jgi:aerobic carbon-monoxide dehydrogenase medium subunit
MPGPRSGSAYRKLPHPASSYAVAAVSAAVRLDGEDRVARAALAVGGVAAVPFRAHAAEAELTGRRLDDEAAHAAAGRLFDGAEPMGDLYASADYRVHIARLYAVEALLAAGRMALQGAGAG